MERLPQEIIDQIIDYSPWLTGRRSAPKFVTVSKRFQLSIERHTFREIDINHVELERFAELFTHPHRRNLLKHLGFKIKLLLCRKYPEATEREANNKVATDAIFKLLKCLCRWKKNCSIGLFITSRPYQLGFSGTKLDYQYDYLEILYPEQLPQVDCIRWLLLNNPEYRKKPGFREFSPLSYLALATRLPCLKGVFLSYTEPGEFLAFRQSLREDLVQAINKTPSMANVYFNIHGPDYTGHDPPSLVPNQEEDRLSLALRRLADSVKRFRYSGPLDPCFFWPSSLARNPQPFWQEVTLMSITLNPAAPSGTWYTGNGPQNGQEAFALHLKDQSPPGYGTEEQTVSALEYLSELTKKMKPEVAKRNFQRMKAPERFNANPDTVMPLLRSVTRAIAQMRSLQLFKLRDADSLSTWYSTNSLKVEYFLPGVLDREYREELDGLPLNKPRVLLRARGLAESGCCGSELEDMFRKVSITNHHQEAIVTWI
ncbi:hypothetical protein GCG54_00012832 [Colletotrichum gloeosporioides]|uniref:F-box domain-containing protein n=1 Tax=Colletotrichum gloeosporioides TaxID=474922 RepID=A0A8H4CSX3_COLGL|nr:uncharacterized protein GCG54_00012832 [Colletotrichum gloeosporioides]KAF3809548.1 hypothetical protein GCG54_00012832 [Colletotrichum gloeosporioides]